MLEEEIRELMKKSLKDCFSSFRENHKINIHVNGQNDISIGYRTAERISEMKDSTHFDIQVIGHSCYILHIELDKQERGRGIGWSLYDAIHCFARNIGSKRIIQNPSGWTPKGETRREYLLKRGYIPSGDTEVEFKL